TSYAPKNDYAAKTRIIDINTADSSAFISLPGIGSKLAARIINFRQKLGGFATVNQIAETYGLPDSTFQLVKTRMECNAAAVKKININTAEMSDLRTHPYIKWNIANAIVNYRMQHGNYKTIEDIKKIEIITPDVFNRIAPYLII
ncbi:MAG TPA: helix-hairpin-helix domain-containing protein, partial [Segetibacter sp.]